MTEIFYDCNNIKRSEVSSDMLLTKLYRKSHDTENPEQFRSLVMQPNQDHSELFLTCDPFSMRFRKFSEQEQFLTPRGMQKSELQMSEKHIRSTHQQLSRYFNVFGPEDYTFPPPQIELKQSFLLDDDREEEVQPYKEKKKKKSVNRLTKIQRKPKQPSQDKLKWSWDTSGALIRLMQRSKTTRRIMNTYIWILMMLRGFYLFLIIENMIEKRDELQNFTFFWAVFSVYLGIRIMFALIVLKILVQGAIINDQKVKIVYETYKATLETSISKNVPMMVITPPELSFIFITTGQKTTSSGFYQVQNFNMKTLEVFFFVPFLVYFLYDQRKLNVPWRILIDRFSEQQVYDFTSIVLIVDLGLFCLLTIYLLLNNQRRKTSIV